MPIYTKTGDAGNTSLWGGQRVPKTSLRVDTLGTLDETQAAIGVARAFSPDSETDILLEKLQEHIYRLNAEIAMADERIYAPLAAEDIALLELVIDEIEPLIENTQIPLSKFLRPGGSALVAHLHLARTICRRAERLLWQLHEQEPIRIELIKYTNRLSDALFQLARKFTVA